MPTMSLNTMNAKPLEEVIDEERGEGDREEQWRHEEQKRKEERVEEREESEPTCCGRSWGPS